MKTILISGDFFRFRCGELIERHEETAGFVCKAVGSCSDGKFAFSGDRNDPIRETPRCNGKKTKVDLMACDNKNCEILLALHSYANDNET